MHSSKLYQLYQTLDKKDLRLFKKWLISPVHNKHASVQELFRFFYTRKSYTIVTLTKERAWKYLYPTQNYDDLRIRHIMSNAYEVLESFVRYNCTENMSFFQQKILAIYLFEQKMEKKAHKTLAEAEVLLKENIRHEGFYYHQYELEVLKLEEISKKQNRNRDFNIMPIIDNVRLFFMITTLRYACRALEHQNLQKIEYEIPLLESILREIEENDYSIYPLLQIYYHGYYSLKEPEVMDHFFALKKYLDEEQLSIKERNATLLMCINYLLKKLNVGKVAYIQETFELYQYGINSGYLLEEGQLSVFAYKNIVTLGLHLKKYAWIERFILDYSQYLPQELRENYKHFNTAKLAFDRGDFNKAMDLLLQVEYDELLLNIDAKVILLKIYYQEGYYDSLDAFLGSFKVFLHRKKSLAYLKKNYTNLITFTKQLLALNGTKETIEKLKKDIDTTPQLAERKWLLEQL